MSKNKTESQLVSVAKLEHPKLDEASYKAQLASLQLELMHYHFCLFRQQKRVVVVFEGPDAAGKGGAIRRAVRHLDPRGLRVHSIGPPNSIELQQHYLQRFWSRLPKNGQMAVFDRSWYGRVLVERVELGLKNWNQYYREISEFERMLVDDGIVVIKILLYIDKKEQRQRLRARLENVEKAWKIGPADLQSYGFHKEYEAAFDEMLNKTSLTVPWQVVAANDKRHARIAVLKAMINSWREALGEPQLGIMSPEFAEKAYRILS
ncbi:UDP-galactose-lipid carrier transferase [Spongiibacter sp. KMU-158]|uniref:UDP-galactose-lipid carrier transferase n=1 Tax=Spongiibacter pelagi TaxID=2760804 RepID=A0A927BYP9_9GAMM|nr:UDP-galactose-lipid carrier transferase [Spongiibacter pelagi]MBD2858013.1 UDP-galactose-lipid carrier transferase [Spongiibacter pelagi]